MVLLCGRGPGPSSCPDTGIRCQREPREQVRKAVIAAIAEARKQNLPMAEAVVDTAGLLVAFERLDRTQTANTGGGTGQGHVGRDIPAADQAFRDALASGGAGLRVLTLRGANAIEGGLPRVIDGKIIGAIGVSGGTPYQDGGVAKLGVNGLAAK